MSVLVWRNIVCIPSIHGKIPFAAAVREELDRKVFDCIALELPSAWKTATLEAVELLPRITAVATKREGFVVMPGDSLIEGAYQGIKRGIATEFIDLDVECDYPTEPHLPFPDPYVIQGAGLARYFDLGAPHFRLNRAPLGHETRNRHMAFRLSQLSAKHQKVLFVCGAAHWEEIVEMLENGTGADESAQSSSRRPRVVRFEDNAILNTPPWNGEIPFFRWLFWQGTFSLESGLAQLLDAAVREYRYPVGVREVEKVLQYAARLARLAPALTPHIHDVLSAARDIVGAAFAGEVMKVTFSYPSQDNLAELEPCLQKTLVAFQPRGWRTDRDGVDIELIRAEFDEKERRNPKVGDAENVQFSAHSWGRYADEMEREEAFLGAIVQKYLQAAHPERGESVKFEGDLRGGLDARETLRARLGDLGSRDLYVREEEGAIKDDIGAVILLFDPDEQTHDDSCYTYGRHLAFGFVSPPQRGGATAKVRWGLLASFLRTYDGDEKRAVVSQLQSGEIGFDTYEECLVETLYFARKPRVLFVASHPAESWLENEARQAGKMLSYIPIGSLPESLVEEIRTYNVYFYPK